jgi:hypothetical protein
MKNFIIAAAVVILLYLAYNHFSTGIEQPSSQANSINSLISPAAKNAEVFIITPGDGSTVTSPVSVEFGITNMEIAAAGDDQPFSGHHHLLIDLEELPDMTKPLPANDQIIHFGKGQTKTELKLEPGKHSLQLLLGNYLHIPHQTPVISKKITITVE